MALINFAQIADGVMLDATTTDGERSDLASLCLKKLSGDLCLPFYRNVNWPVEQN